MKFKRIKFVIFITIITLLILYGSSSILGDIYPKEVAQETYGELSFCGKPLNINQPLYFVNGRLFLPLFKSVSALGGNVTETDDGYVVNWKKSSFQFKKNNNELLYRQLFFDDETPYIYIYDIAQLFNLAVVFNSKQNKVALYNRQKPTRTETGSEQLKKGYLRLEDVTADFGISGNFTDETLEKLRVLADYMWGRGQSYYIAWIPLYTNPPMGIQNDLTENFNFYNAGFIYTLDYIVNRNGHIVLHGLTHQENDTISAIGAEFGAHTPFSSREISRRMARAKEIAEILGYEENIFEFPHYASTERQVKIAENYFDVLYQQSPYAKTLGHIEHVNKWLRTVTFVPTPLGYVNSADEFGDTLEKIDNLKAGQEASLFMHPYLDYGKITCSNDANGNRVFSYDESGIIPGLVNKMTEIGVAFSAIDI